MRPNRVAAQASGQPYAAITAPRGSSFTDMVALKAERLPIWNLEPEIRADFRAAEMGGRNMQPAEVVLVAVRLAGRSPILGELAVLGRGGLDRQRHFIGAALRRALALEPILQVVFRVRRIE